MHLVAKGQGYDSLQKGFMFFEELVFSYSYYIHLKQLVGRESVGKNMVFKRKYSSGFFFFFFKLKFWH